MLVHLTDSESTYNYTQYPLNVHCIFNRTCAGPRAVLSLQTPVVIEGRMAQACLSLTRLDRLSQSASITLSTMSTSSTATGVQDKFWHSINHTKVVLHLQCLLCEPLQLGQTMSVQVNGLLSTLQLAPNKCAYLLQHWRMSW